MIVSSLALLASISATSAQEQEGKLVDRILKPNMSLVNTAQNKQFDTVAISSPKLTPSRSFHTPARSFAKSLPAMRTFSPRALAVRHFGAADMTANVSAKSQLTKIDTVEVASVAYDTRVAPESGQSLSTARFAGDRPFLGRGKSQKALSAQDRPLTIEQVRELLNKNK
jgi:hypothetical protein